LPSEKAGGKSIKERSELWRWGLGADFSKVLHTGNKTFGGKGTRKKGAEKGELKKLKNSLGSGHNGGDNKAAKGGGRRIKEKVRGRKENS